MGHIERGDIQPYPPAWFDFAGLLDEPPVLLATTTFYDGERVSSALHQANIPFSFTAHLGCHFSVREQDHARSFGILERDAKARDYPIRLFRPSRSECGTPPCVEVMIGSFSAPRKAPIRVRANLAGAFLRGANLVDASLEQANLAGSDLREAKLTSLFLIHADPQGAWMSYAGLCGANLCFADLRGADLRFADLRGAYLSAAYTMRGRQRMGFSGAQLQGANLEGADLREARLWGAELTGANLRGADLRLADFAGMHLSPSQWDTVGSWAGSLRPSTDLSGADLKDADLQGARYGTDTHWPSGFDPARHGAVITK